jgi:hypothetical protein
MGDLHIFSKLDKGRQFLFKNQINEFKDFCLKNKSTLVQLQVCVKLDLNHYSTAF